MERLLTQIRDNLRFSNWTCFPGNTILYSYNINGQLARKEFLREGTPQFRIIYFYDNHGNILSESYLPVQIQEDGRIDI